MTENGAGPLVIERQGSFFVGGRQVTAIGSHDPSGRPVPDAEGRTHWIDQMYVQYQIPPHARPLPLVLVHGGGGTGRVWETTPDGREGYGTIFLRRGFAVYIVDTPRGGRAGVPSFNGEFGRLDDATAIVPNRTRRSGLEKLWTRWRLGPVFPEVFPEQAFPMGALDAFAQHIRPIVGDESDVAARALLALLDRIGPALLVTHSNSGLPGWLAGCRSPHVRGIVSYEPGFVFPDDDMPEPLPLFAGTLAAGDPVDRAEFSRLAAVPIQVVYGDNIPTGPVPDLPADGRRAQVLACRMFVDALSREGGRASMLHLPDVGLRGNSHFMFSDRNNVSVADQLSAFLAREKLDA